AGEKLPHQLVGLSTEIFFDHLVAGLAVFLVLGAQRQGENEAHEHGKDETHGGDSIEVPPRIAALIAGLAEVTPPSVTSIPHGFAAGSAKVHLGKRPSTI